MRSPTTTPGATVYSVKNRHECPHADLGAQAFRAPRGGRRTRHAVRPARHDVVRARPPRARGPACELRRQSSAWRAMRASTRDPAREARCPDAAAPARGRDSRNVRAALRRRGAHRASTCVAPAAGRPCQRQDARRGDARAETDRDAADRRAGRLRAERQRQVARGCARRTRRSGRCSGARASASRTPAPTFAPGSPTRSTDLFAARRRPAPGHSVQSRRAIVAAQALPPRPLLTTPTEGKRRGKTRPPASAYAQGAGIPAPWAVAAASIAIHVKTANTAERVNIMLEIPRTRCGRAV